MQSLLTAIFPILGDRLASGPSWGLILLGIAWAAVGGWQLRRALRPGGSFPTRLGYRVTRKRPIPFGLAVIVHVVFALIGIWAFANGVIGVFLWTTR